MKAKSKPARKLGNHRYTVMDELMASPTEPLPISRRDYQLGIIHEGIEAMRSAESPTAEHWCAIADLVNLLESLVEMGEIDDAGGWIAEASREVADAAFRHADGKPLRLTGAGLNAVNNAMEGYELAINNLPARTMIRAHRKTERRIGAIRAGRGQRADVVVVSL